MSKRIALFSAAALGALALTAEITAHSSFSHAANKRLLIETDGLSQPAGLAHEIYHSAGRGPDMAERIAAFTRKAASK